MSFKRLAFIIVLAVFLIFLLIEIVSLYRDAQELKNENDSLKEKLSLFQNENEEIKRDMIYYQDSENLEKSLREKFNYKKPGETMIIVVPSQE
jgi:cell division protein FtsB